MELTWSPDIAASKNLAADYYHSAEEEGWETFLDAVLSVQTTLGVAVFNPVMVVARVIWMFAQVVVVK